MLKQIGLEPTTFDVHATASDQTQLVSSFVRRTLFKVVHGARSAPSDGAPCASGPKNSLDRGAQLEVVWLDPA